MLNSSTFLRHKNLSTTQMASSSKDGNQRKFLKLFGETIVVHPLLEDDVDLGYKIFLEHLRKDGTSYVLEMVSAHDGKPVCVKYEEDDVSSDEREMPRKSDNQDSPNRMSLDSLSSLGKKNQKLHASGLSSCEKNKSSCDKSGQIIPFSSSPDDIQGSEPLIGESYQTFLNNVRIHDESLVLELGNGVVCKYEEEDPVQTASGDNVSSAKRKFEEESQNQSNSDIISSKEGRDCLGKKRHKSHVPILASNGKSESSSEKSGQIMLRSLSSDHNQENEPLTDESYLSFLNHVRVQGATLVVEVDNNVVVKYEEETEICTESQGFAAKIIKRESESHKTSLQTSDSSGCEDEANSSEIQCCSHQFQFKEELMACLDKPFDQKEHDNLLHEARTPKLLQRSRDLRSRSLSYGTGQRGRSYLDHYPDLATEIKYSSPDRTLTLLRGFFFWLKHLSHEGAIVPWKELPKDNELVPVSTNEEPLETLKECSDIQPIEIEITEGDKVESGMPAGMKEVIEVSED